MLGAVLTALLVPGTALAQAPSSLAELNGRVLIMTSSTTANPGFPPITAARFSASRPPEFSGNLLAVYPPTMGPTNAIYVPVSGTEGELRLARYNTAVDWETNQIALTFTGAGGGTYQNTIRRAGVTLLQTNRGAFTLETGTNIVPRIVLQTSGPQIFQPGANVNLGMNVVAGWNVRYQWRLEGTNLPGATNNFLAVPNLQASQTGAYACVVSNPMGEVTSAVIPVQLSQPIVFVRQPQSLTVNEMNWAALDVEVTGSVQNYTWYRNGTAVRSGTNQLVFPIASLSDAGSYQVVIDNFGLSATSQVAVLQVQAVVPDWNFLDRPFRRVAVEGMAVPGATGHTFKGWASSALTPLITWKDGRLHFVAGTSAGVRSLFRWTLDTGLLETLIFTNTVRPEGGTFLDTFYPTDEGAGTVNFVGVGSGMYSWTASGISTLIGSNTPAPGRPGLYLGGPGSFGRRGAGVAISATVVDSPGSFSALGAGIFFHDGTVFSRIADDTTDLPGAMAGYAGRPSGNAVNFDGTTIVFSTVTSLAPGAQGGFFKATPGGAITKLADHTDNRPGSTTVKYTGFTDIDVDGEYIFGVANSTVWRYLPDGTATNLGPGTAVSAAGPRMAYFGNSTLLRRWNNGTNATVLQLGRYLDGKPVSQILAFDGQGDDLAVLVKFTDLTHGIYVVGGPVSAPPIITRQPADALVMEQGTATFAVSAAGSGPLGYQWRRDGTNLPGMISSSVSFPQITPAAQGAYSVVVSNASGMVTSRVATLTTILPATPTIWLAPGNQPHFYASNATFTVVASGAPPLEYRWYKTVGTTDQLIPGANSPTLVIPNLSEADKGNYFVLITNASGGVVSQPVSIALLYPWITRQPTSTTAVAGSTVTFTVSAIGPSSMTYQWLKYPQPLAELPGETNTTLTLANVTTNQATTYVVRINSPDGPYFSQGAILTVLSGAVPVAPTLGQPILVAGSISFPLPTQAGFTYRVESKVDLADAEWSLEQTVAGDGTTKTITLSTGGPRKFLRVVVLP